MESNKRVGLVAVAVAALVVVSTFFIPTVFAGRHRNYEAAMEPDSNDYNGIITSALAETDSDDYYDHNIMVKDESSTSATGSKRLEVDKGCPSSVCDTTNTNPCRIGCICVPYVPLTSTGVCIGICCQIVPPPRPPPSPLSPSPPPLTSF